MIKLNQLRSEINKVDSKLVSLLKQRLEIIRKIGKFKKENNLEIFDSAREREIISNFLSLETNLKDKIYIEKFLNSLFNISKDLQKNED